VRAGHDVCPLLGFFIEKVAFFHPAPRWRRRTVRRFTLSSCIT
jgi:hypothetical protein